MVEFFRGFGFINSLDRRNVKLGIAVVKSKGAIKNCKVRSLMVEYFLTESEVVIIAPNPCNRCEKKDACLYDFGEQIIQKNSVKKSYAYSGS